MACTFGITLEYALDMCAGAECVPLAFRQRLLQVCSGGDPGVWVVMRGIVQFNLFAVLDACIRDGFAVAHARDAGGRNVMFYATFALLAGNFVQWVAYLRRCGAQLAPDADHQPLSTYVLRFAFVYDVPRDRVQAALCCLEQLAAPVN